ncbi:MAG TPA: hypothetical protein VGN23_00115 [Verrucomicrobiae bacterium]|jgi:hypothetical protein
MTQIVGIVCKESVGPSSRDAIFIACESQYTIGGTKVTDAQKLSIIRFNDRNEALVAQAGSVIMSSRAVRYMAEIAKDQPLDSEFAVARIAEEAVARVRAEIIQMMQPRGYSIDEQQQLFCDDNHYFALMIGHFYEVPNNLGFKTGNPRLWTITLHTPMAEQAFPYAVIGSGSNLARFHLSKLELDKIKWELGMPLAIHVIEQVKGNDIYCDGDIKVGVSEINKCWFYTENLINKVAKEVKRIQANLNSKYKNELVATINTIAEQNKKEIEEMLKTEEKEENETRELTRRTNPLTVGVKKSK